MSIKAAFTEPLVEGKRQTLSARTSQYAERFASDIESNMGTFCISKISRRALFRSEIRCTVLSSHCRFIKLSPDNLRK